MIVLGVLACAAGGQRLSDEEVRDAQACVECHPDHVREWSGSMHAYASEDPIFRALNALGQEQTDGALGDFCVKCHAPVAVALGMTTDGLNLDALPEAVKGIGCYTCHQIEAVEGDHNNPLRLAMDRVMRGGIRDPVKTRAHDSAYEPLLDREQVESSDACGSCHDIVTPLGAHIERTYLEWRQSLFGRNPAIGLSCGSCHMQGREGVAAEADGVLLRRVHDHRMPGVDIATTPWVETEDQRAAVQELLDDTVSAFLCVQPSEGDTTLAVVTLENVAGGHFFPSGATADRRAWVQVEAFADGTRFWSSGAVDAQTPLSEVSAEEDPDLWRMYSTLLDVDGAPTHNFWDAADIERGDLLPVQTTLDPNDPTFVQTHQSHQVLIRGDTPDRITMAVRLRPVPLDLAQDLVASGHLDAAVLAALPEWTLQPTVLEWTGDVPVGPNGLSCVPEAPPPPG